MPQKKIDINTLHDSWFHSFYGMSTFVGLFNKELSIYMVSSI